MRNQLLRTIAVSALCTAFGALAQTPGSATDPSGSSAVSPNPGAPGAYDSSSSPSGWAARHLNATGRMGHQAVRGSQLTGAQITGSAGSEIGTITDTIVDPSSGRIEFAIVSMTSATGAPTGTSTPRTETAPGAAPGTQGAVGATPSSTLVGGKQVAVPWMLLRLSPRAGTTGLTSTTQQPSFVFAGDNTKLDSAPAFDANTDLNQPTWRQSVFSYFGLSGPGRAAGAAETPGSSSSGTSGSESAIPQPQK